MTEAFPLDMDFSKPALVDIDKLAWEASPLQGVERRKLERLGAESGHATSIVRYAAGSHFRRHTHTGGEEYFVLEGTFSDHKGDFTKGCYVRNPPGSAHAPFTREGCTIFVKLCQMQMRNEPEVCIETHRHQWIESSATEIHIIPLFDNAFERVQLNKLNRNTLIENKRYAGGFEFLLLSGQLTVNGRSYRNNYWGRFPAGSKISLSSQEACVFWSKEGHLIK